MEPTLTEMKRLIEVKVMGYSFCLLVTLVMIFLQTLRWCCVDCVIHHERDVREEQKYMCVARTSNNRVIPME